MKTKTREYFEKELENILLIHFNAKFYFADVKYLNNPDTVEEMIVAGEYSTIKRIRIAFWRLGIIEIAKLFQKTQSQHYNLIDYIESLIIDYELYPWLHGINRDRLTEWLTILNSERIKKLRENISIQRNKFFAHTDRTPSKKLENSQMSFEDIQELIALTENIIFDLKEKVLRIHTNMEIPGLERAGNILEAFAALKEKKEAISKLEYEFKKENCKSGK